MENGRHVIDLGYSSAHGGVHWKWAKHHFGVSYRSVKGIQGVIISYYKSPN